MKAGLTVLLAVASASVNTHVKVETVNFDEDLLNTEKNIVETSAWKEKKDKKKKEGPQTKPEEPEETKPEEAHGKEETKGDDREPGINVTFKVKECGKLWCKGELTMRSHGFTTPADTPSTSSNLSSQDDLSKLQSLNLKLDTILEEDPDRQGCVIVINKIRWLSRNEWADEIDKEGHVVQDIRDQIPDAKKNKGTITWKIPKTILKGYLMESTLELIDSLNKKLTEDEKNVTTM